MGREQQEGTGARRERMPIADAVGTVLAHDITEIRPGEFKGAAFRKGHIIREEDLGRLQRIGKEHLFSLQVEQDELHEDEAALLLAQALRGTGVAMRGAPHEGKITLVAETDGLLKVNREALLAFNLLGEVMCATLHTNTPVRKGQRLASTRAIPLVVKRAVVDAAIGIAQGVGGIVSVRKLRAPKAGVVITGNEVFSGRVRDAFAPVIRKKIEAVHGEIAGIAYAPDDEAVIEERLRELLAAGADLLILTGGMSVDPDDVTRFAIRNLGAHDVVYGSAMLPGAMFLVAYLGTIPVLGIPACGMYAATTVFDLVLPRVLAGERITRRELAELGHGGLCLKCDVCRYPVCPFGK